MPSLPIDIYRHSSRLLDSIKSYYVKEAGMSSSAPIPVPVFPIQQILYMHPLAKDMSCC